MNKEEILIKIKPYIDQAKTKISPEDEKVDFKSKWYDLTNEISKSEFLKDLSAIANTLGADGFIIIGIDENGNFEETNIVASGFNDESKLHDLVTKNIEGGVDFSCVDISYEGKSISVIHIPPSFRMPHVIKNYVSKSGKQETQKIFIRNGTQTRPTTKYDLDKIYMYRGKIKPEYYVEIFIPSYEIEYSTYLDNADLEDPNRKMFYVEIRSMTLENRGNRVFVSSKFFFEFDETVMKGSSSKAFESIDYIINGERRSLVYHPIILEPEKVVTLNGFRFTAPVSTLDRDLKEALLGRKFDRNNYDRLTFEIRLLNSQELRIKPNFVPYLFPSYPRFV